jgi:hypothetical protein
VDADRRRFLLSAIPEAADATTVELKVTERPWAKAFREAGAAGIRWCARKR